jgi:hypothetical protein
MAFCLWLVFQLTLIAQIHLNSETLGWNIFLYNDGRYELIDVFSISIITSLQHKLYSVFVEKGPAADATDAPQP